MEGVHDRCDPLQSRPVPRGRQVTERWSGWSAMRANVTSDAGPCGTRVKRLHSLDVPLPPTSPHQCDVETGVSGIPGGDRVLI